MNILKLHSRIHVCLNRNELLSIFNLAKKRDLLSEMKKNKYTFDEIKNDKEKMIEIASIVSNNMIKNKTEHEIFFSLFILLRFYEETSEVCFEIKDSYNYRRGIPDLESFKEAIKEDTMSDVIIKTAGDLRIFQLKRYKNQKLDTKSLIKYIDKKLAHYGNSLGSANLLIILEPDRAWEKMEIDFSQINKSISKVSSKNVGQILIGYNENNVSNVIIQVFPGLTRSEVKYRDLQV
jgi:hypothetical protein